MGEPMISFSKLQPTPRNRAATSQWEVSPLSQSLNAPPKNRSPRDIYTSMDLLSSATPTRKPVQSQPRGLCKVNRNRPMSTYPVNAPGPMFSRALSYTDSPEFASEPNVLPCINKTSSAPRITSETTNDVANGIGDYQRLQQKTSKTEVAFTAPTVAENEPSQLDSAHPKSSSTVSAQPSLPEDD